MKILYVRRRYYGSSLDWKIYHWYRDLYRYYRPSGYYFRFKGLEGFFRGSLHRTMNVTAKPYTYLANNPDRIDKNFDAIVVDSVKKETDDFYQYKVEDLHVLNQISDLPKVLLVATDRAGDVPRDDFLDYFHLIYKREPFRDRDRYDLSPSNKDKIRPTMLACPMFEPTRWNIDELDPSNVGEHQPADDYENQVFFVGNNTSELREEVVKWLEDSNCDFYGGLYYRDCPPRIDEKNSFSKLSDSAYKRAIHRSRISLALDGHGEFTFRHLENWFMSSFMLCNTSIRDVELPINHQEDKHYVCFESRDDLLDKIKHFTNEDKERREIAQNGRELVTQEYDLKHHGQQIRDEIEELL